MGVYESTTVGVGAAAPVDAASEITIAAGRDVVWGLLTDFERWPAWNRDVGSVTVDGPAIEGMSFKWKSGGHDHRFRHPADAGAAADRVDREGPGHPRGPRLGSRGDRGGDDRAHERDLGRRARASPSRSDAQDAAALPGQGPGIPQGGCRAGRERRRAAGRAVECRRPERARRDPGRSRFRQGRVRFSLLWPLADPVDRDPRGVAQPVHELSRVMLQVAEVVQVQLQLVQLQPEEPRRVVEPDTCRRCGSARPPAPGNRRTAHLWSRACAPAACAEARASPPGTDSPCGALTTA